MARTLYVPKKFTPAHRQVVEAANAICEEYAAQGLVLTLRQLYYQFVARDLIPNKQTEYDRLGNICRDARLAGEMDWDFLIDRTRNLLERSHWDSPHDMLRWAAERYYNDLWRPQKRRVEVWIEKDAGIGVIEGVCHHNDVPYFSCRGYTSVSEVHAAAQRIRWYVEAGEQVLILHVGDHDPSGIDMTRDIDDRLRLFLVRDWKGLHMGRGPASVGDIKQNMREHMRTKGSKIADGAAPWRVKRIALNYDQVRQYGPPPNPAKTTDARFQRYYEETGLDESWELDALDPAVLQNLIASEIEAWRNEQLWRQAVQDMEEARETIARASRHWSHVVATLPEEQQ